MENCTNSGIVEEILKAVAERGWKVTEHLDSPELLLEWRSPAGEDIYIETTRETLQDDLVDEGEAFDVDEHIDVWAERRGKGGVPDSYAGLLQDARAIQRELDALARIAKSSKPGGGGMTFEEKALAAAIGFFSERHGEVLSREWGFGVNGFVGRENGAVVFVEVDAGVPGSMPNPAGVPSALGRCENAALEWLGANPQPEGRIRFDKLDLVRTNSNAAVVRYFIDRFAVA